MRIDTYRSSGSGGQHVNTTDSAVRITHIATGIAVACQAERSQHKNRAKAWEMLRSRLYEEELKKREAAANATEASKTDIGWGHQIRSYVLQPYQLVKDLRTGVESTSPSSVLDGDLDEFMEASLSQRIEGGAGAGGGGPRLGYVHIQVRPACERWFPALPVLTSLSTLRSGSRKSPLSAGPDLNRNTPAAP